MQHDFGAMLRKSAHQALEVTYVPSYRTNGSSSIGEFEVTRFGRGWQRVPEDIRARRLEPKAQPSAFETRMPRHEDALTAPERHVPYLIFTHGRGSCA